MASSPLDMQTAGYNSPHDWLMSLAMDLAALCDTWIYKWHQWMPFSCFQHGHSLCPPLHGSPHFPTLHPYRRNACSIGYASKNYLTMADNSANYPFNSWCIDRL